ncbi:SpaA isopeptide-forming pilin-related protein [Enterococcus avium]|uniref:SpaA isopeptide-forming pilin-related protein n=1 Tax=Enterococcus avium TaxID=33945 RepID=UPI00288EB909|nr:SpaA isopeptide-forming pilin-related protein [Enterococcus avium]MDT2409379.1 SpaA isopeptide-forming pilin-related protein [Enterococcus avium]MDT2413979.1 SpaA isopeptide-forming pilin-related protein [Enterococcus avium]MDT2444259.1 SpaA isopeptide-forming pilin-related protein [Enterococcus avium]MDT2474517.1 SpaA isopeptide-forming pilin-related protein [Enterococcus avium]
MKKKHLLMLVVLLFSFITETLPSLVTAYAETTKTELIDEKFLKVSYEYESLEDTNRWRITFSRQSEESDKEQRLKLKVTNEKGKVITYPAIKNMDEKDEWLIEKNYSASMEGQLVFELPKSTKKLNLDVQLDEQTLSNGKDAKIQENILDIKESFVLKAQDTKEETKTSESKAAVKTSSEDFIGPPEPEEVVPVPATAVPNNGLLRMDPPKYTNKAPVYTSNNGTYPTCYWTPTGQSNVRNHQGGYEKESGWDGVTSWDVSSDDYTKSYIKYGVEKTKPNISLRKYASETSKDDEFNVRLNVRGSTIPKPGVDVCFVLDNSASMIQTEGYIGGISRKTLSVNSLQKLIDKFKAANPETDSLRIGGVIFSAKNNNYGNPIVPMSSNESNWQNLVNTYKNTPSDGDTYTQKALMDAQTMLNNVGGTDRRKVIFLLTDGAPNMSAVPIALKNDTNIYYDGVRITQNDGNSIAGGSYLQAAPTGGKSYTVKIPEGYYIAQPNRCIYSHLTPVNSTAADIKDQGMEINSIAINIKKNFTYEGHSDAELIRGLYKIASKKSNATGDIQNDYQFYHAKTTGDFDISFDDWFNSVIQTVDKGVIEDPIGDMFELVGKPTVKEIKKSGVPAIETSKLPNDPVVTNNTIKVDNINLYGQQEVQLDYKLRLKTDAVNYEGDTWYQTNGRTTLTPTPERTTDKLDFGVPSVKGKANKFEIPVEKKWSDSHMNTENYWGLRANSVRVVLQRKSGSSWVDVETKTLNAANNWKTSFSADGGSTIYRVVEPSRTTGYAKPDSNVNEFTAKTLPSKGVQITNKLLKGATVFCKYMEDGKTPFTSDLPRFTIRRKSDGKVLVSNLEPNARGQVLITDIPLGDFVIDETYVPQGYDKMTDIDVKAVENSAGTDLNITVNGKTSLHEVTNKRTKDLEIPVEKVWSDSHRGTENYWGLRTNYVRVTLQKRTGSTWEDVESLTLTPIDNWKGVFQNVEGGNTVYRVVEEARTIGCAKPTYNYGTSFTAATKPKEGIKLTNKLLTGKAVICKYMDDGKTPFGKDKPKFTVTRRSDGKVLATDLEPDNNGQVTIENIPMGDFVIEESYVPAGYEKMTNIELKAVENAAGTALNITLNGKASPYKVTNKLADFKLKIKKVDQDGNELRGASFRLIGTSYDQTETGGPYFEFTGLRPGEYSLSETVVPNGYQGMSGTVRISISREGVVSIQSNPNVSGSGGVGNPNLIQLTVTNRKRGAGPLPSTGGSGTAMFFKVALGVISTAGGLLGSLYWLHTKRRGS